MDTVHQTLPAAADRGDASALRPGWGMLRGESLIAGMALATLVLLLATLGVAATLTAWSQKKEAEGARFAQARAVTELLARNCETLLAAGEVSALRRTVVEARSQHGLERCRVILPNGKVIADSDPSGITEANLPVTWPAGTLDGRETAGAGDGKMKLVRSVLVRGRGPVTLETTARVEGSSGGIWDLITALGGLGAIAVAVHWLVYRHLRKRVQALGMIREALGAFGNGERATEALALGEGLGPEVAAWNELMTRCRTAQKESVAQQLQDKLERRQEARSELELACDSLSVGLAIIDEQGRIRHANGAVASLLRTRREELSGKLLTELVIGDENARTAMEALISGKSMQRRSWESTIGDESSGGRAGAGETSVLRLTLRPMRREDSCAALLTLEDITQQRVAQASRSAFVAQATHELRTPLTNMRLCVESALEEPEQDPKAVGQCLNMINGEIRRLERMVSEMLSVAEIEAGSLKLHGGDVRLDALFERLRMEVEPMAAEKQIKLVFDLPPKFPVIYGDVDKLVLALHNLIGNAIKYTPAGGQVTVAVRADGKRVTVDVADTGIGVRPEEQERIFERFYRAKDPRVGKITGTGLGLALSREVARIHGGDVTVQSELDKGSTFTLTVPVGKAA